MRAPAAAALLALAGLAAGGTAGCSSDTPFELSGDAVVLPATLGEALRIASARALDWSESAFLTRMGGGFTVMDAEGRARSHSFVFHARDGQTTRRLTVHLIEGIPWLDDQVVPPPPPPLAPPESLLDSDDVVAAAIDVAETVNASFPDSIPVGDEFAARIESVPRWPEPSGTDDPVEVAWRVDFLTLSSIGESTVYFSTARFYFRPDSLDLFGTVIPFQPELYPFP